MPPINYTSLMPSRGRREKQREELITEYFYAGYKQLEICALLYTNDGIILSVRHLNRILRQLNLQRHSEPRQVLAAIEYELSGSGAYLGCRSMARRLMSKYNLCAPRATVLLIQKELDPAGVRSRREHKLSRRVYRNAGPNFLIHLDGHDKIKPYGFAIHGCMDGFSRRVLWLKVSNTNNDPAVVASYFINYLKEIQGVPRCIQMDEGTENIIIEDIQKAFRWFHNDDMHAENSTRRGSSHSNQRIERWWRTLRNSCVGFWIDKFKDMVHTGQICTANALHIDSLRYCLMDLIQRELDQVSADWNQHRVRYTRHAECPPGKPDIMYFNPQLYGAQDYTFPASMDDVAEAERLVTKTPLVKGCSPEFCELAWQMMQQTGRNMPENAGEGFHLYEWLVGELSAGN